MKPCSEPGCEEPKHRRESRCREHALQKMREYYQRNKEANAERGRRFRENNPEYRREYHEANKDRENRNSREWRVGHLEYYRARESRRRQDRSVRMSKQDKDASVAWRKTIADDPCFYCGQRADSMHDDHMMPVVRGGTDHWWNLVRACSTCNHRKFTKTAEEFLAERKEVIQP